MGRLMTGEQSFFLHVLAVLFLFFLALAAMFAIGGCAHPSPAMAEASYTAQLLECASNEPSRAASRACRAEVDRKWGVTDAGADR